MVLIWAVVWSTHANPFKTFQRQFRDMSVGRLTWKLTKKKEKKKKIKGNERMEKKNSHAGVARRGNIDRDSARRRSVYLVCVGGKEEVVSSVATCWVIIKIYMGSASYSRKGENTNLHPRRAGDARIKISVSRWMEIARRDVHAAARPWTQFC